MIAIIDYGAGNLQSVEKALRHIGCPCQVADSPAQLAQAQAAVLPGVGAFGQAMAALPGHLPGPAGAFREQRGIPWREGPGAPARKDSPPAWGQGAEDSPHRLELPGGGQARLAAEGPGA